MALPPTDSEASGIDTYSGLCGAATLGSACEITGGGTPVGAANNEVGTATSTLDAGQSLSFTVYSDAVPQAGPVSDVQLCAITSQAFAGGQPGGSSRRVPLGG